MRGGDSCLGVRSCGTACDRFNPVPSDSRTCHPVAWLDPPLDSRVVSHSERLSTMPTRRSSASRRASSDSASTLSAVVSIRRIVQALRLASQRTQVQAGISAAQLFVLQQLGAQDGLSLTELAARTFTDRSSVADLVDRLRARRFVERAVDPSDRRRAAVHLTPAGRRVLQRSPDAPTTMLIAALTKMEPRQRATLAISLRRLTAALGVADAAAPMLFADSMPRAET